MIQKEKDIIEKAKKILKDIQKKYYNEENIEKIFFSKESYSLIDSNALISVWIIPINEPVFDKTFFLTISDETGEPMSYATSMVSSYEVIKNKEGIYELLK